MQAALGLEKAHSGGIVHRDLKPANVFLVERDDGTTLVKLVDFGIAKVLREAHDARFSRKGITRRGTAIGTPQYMSPEQAQGLETVDHRTDVYSLGAVLFEAIAGHPYMEERATYEQTILQLISTPAPRLSTVVPDIPPALDDLVAEMLEHDLDRRVPNMHAVRERLSAIYPELHGSSVKLRSLPPVSSSSLERYVVHASADPHHATVPGTAVIPLTQRRRKTSALVWVSGAAAVLGIGLGLFALRRPAAASRDRRIPRDRRPHGQLPRAGRVRRRAAARRSLPPRHPPPRPAPLPRRSSQPRPTSPCPPPGLRPARTATRTGRWGPRESLLSSDPPSANVGVGCVAARSPRQSRLPSR